MSAGAGAVLLGPKVEDGEGNIRRTSSEFSRVEDGEGNINVRDYQDMLKKIDEIDKPAEKGDTWDIEMRVKRVELMVGSIASKLSALETGMSSRLDTLEAGISEILKCVKNGNDVKTA